MERVLGKLRRHGPWLGVSLALAVVLGSLSGYMVPVVAYAIFNSFGTWVYLDQPGPWSRRQSVVRGAAAVLMPVGLFALLASDPGGPTPTEAVSGASPDERTRDAAARSVMAPPPSNQG